MIIAVFLFTLIIAYTVCRFIGKQPYLSREKPFWRKLVYWGGILFISIIFNMIIYASGSYSYKLSMDLKNEGIYVLIWLILTYLVIQLLSPSMSLGRLQRSIKAVKNRNIPAEPADKGVILNKNLHLLEASSTQRSNTGISGLGEKDFELFLNTLCWLSFIYVIFINLFAQIITSIYGVPVQGTYLQGRFYEFSGMQEQLNYISRIMLFFTIPIALRQILFYLSKLKKPTAESIEATKRNSSRYEKYMLVKSHLKKNHKRL